MPVATEQQDGGERRKEKKRKEEAEKKEENLSRDLKCVEEQVMARFGKTCNFVSVKANHLWDNRVRVNVFVAREGGDVCHARILSDSFFLVVSSEGEIVRSSPEIVRKYGDLN